MNLPTAALTHRHTVWAATIGALVFGASAYLSLPVQLFPETAPPLVNILTPYPGAAAVDVADGLSDPIETEVAALEGVYEVSSVSQEGLSLVRVEFDYGTDVDLAAVDVQNALTRIRDRLPSAAGASQVLKFSTSDRPVLTLGLLAPDLVPVRRLADDVLAPKLQRVPGVAVVDVFGGSIPEIEIALDRARLEAHGVDPAAVVAAVRSHNVSAPAGRIRTSARQYAFRVDAETRHVSALASIPVSAANGARLRIGDVARVRASASEDLSRFRVGGRPAIALQVLRQEDANTVDVVEALRVKVRDLEAEYPGIEFIEAEEAASFTRQVVDNMLGSVWQALLLASVVIFAFLGSLRRALVVVVSMPMSFALTFAVMQVVGLQLDLVTLTAIILAVGMVVDGSVVVLENISRHHEAGADPATAAREGASEVQFAVIAGNATTLVVLVPLLFLYGFVGKVFGPLALTLMIAFLASLVVALTLVPVLSALVLRRGRPSPLERFSRPWNTAMGRLRDGYLWLLRHALAAPVAVFVAALVLFGAGVGLLRHQGMELLPRMDSGASFVTVETPAGSSLAQTEAVVRDVERVILREPDLVRLATQIGFEPGMHSFGGGGVQGPTQGYLSLTLTPRTARTESIWDIQDRLRQALAAVPGVQSLVVRESGNTAKATTASSIVVRLSGSDPAVLDRLGTDLLPQVAAVPGVINPYRSWRFDERSLDVDLNVDRAHEIGLSPARVATGLRAALDGTDAGWLRSIDADTPIRVRYAEPDRRHRDDALLVRLSGVPAGTVAPLGAIARLRDVRVRGLVTRANLEPTLDLLALHQGRPLSETAAAVAAVVSRADLPRGYTAVVEGESADMAESRTELLGAFASAVIAVYLLLVAQFRSFLHPGTILVSIPLSLVGIAVGLWLGGKPVSMPVMVGLVLLVGIVVNNAIILVDFVRQGRAAGLPRQEALLDAVATRFRPIMMTALSTTVGMVPLALEWALGAERFSPLAMAVIGGLTASTFLTLIVIPVLYDVLDRLSPRRAPASDGSV